MINASPLSMGLLSRQGPPDWHPASEKIKAISQQAAQFCEKKGADISELAIQYSTANKKIPTTLVGTAHPEHMKNNIKILKKPINKEILQQVQKNIKPYSQ